MPLGFFKLNDITNFETQATNLSAHKRLTRYFSKKTTSRFQEPKSTQLPEGIRYLLLLLPLKSSQAHSVFRRSNNSSGLSHGGRRLSFELFAPHAAHVSTADHRHFPNADSCSYYDGVVFSRSPSFSLLQLPLSLRRRRPFRRILRSEAPPLIPQSGVLSQLQAQTRRRHYGTFTP